MTTSHTPTLFKREIFCHGKYLIMDCEKIGDWFICFDEKHGYKLATFGSGTVCEARPEDYETRLLLQSVDKLTRDNAALLNACEMAIGEGDEHKAMKAIMAAIQQARSDL